MMAILKFFLRLIALIGKIIISPLLINCAFLLVIENGFLSDIFYKIDLVKI